MELLGRVTETPCLCGAAGDEIPAERWLHAECIYLYSARGLVGLAGRLGLCVLRPRHSFAGLAVCPAVRSWPWVYFISDAVIDCSEMSPCPLINTSTASIKT